MTWADWLIIGFFVLGTIASISMVGKPRGPITPGTAVSQTVVSTVLIICILATHN